MVERSEGNPSVRICQVTYDSGYCGFNVTKSKWDPYPWISTVDPESPAAAGGVLPGDCLLEVNGEDMLGLRVAEVAARIRSRGNRTTLMLWNSGIDSNCTSESLCCGPMPGNLQRLTTCLSAIIEALECPICLETIPPPAHQCANGHLICLECRGRTERCPICRLRFFRGRSLLSDQVFQSVVKAFDLQSVEEKQQSQIILQWIHGPKKKKKKSKPLIKVTPTNKFLTRIMGSRKSSSVENLSTQLQEASNLSNQKSLSNNEIFGGGSSSVSRSGSILSSRPGSGLLDIHDYPQRPASYHGSAGDLRSRMIADFGSASDLQSSMNNIDFGNVDSQQSIPCPYLPDCLERVSAIQLKNHLKKHDRPLIQFWKSECKIERHWLEVGLVVIECDGEVFFLRGKQERLCVWSLPQDATFTDHETRKATISYNINDNLQPMSITCQVTPLPQVTIETIDDCGGGGASIPISPNQTLRISIHL